MCGRGEVTKKWKRKKLSASRLQEKISTAETVVAFEKKVWKDTYTCMEPLGRFNKLPLVFLNVMEKCRGGAVCSFWVERESEKER